MKGIVSVILKIRKINDCLCVAILLMSCLLAYSVSSTLRSEREMYFVSNHGDVQEVKYSDAMNSKIKTRIYELRQQAATRSPSKSQQQ